MIRMTIEQIQAQISCPSKANRRIFTHLRNAKKSELNALTPQAQQIHSLIKQHGPINRAELLYQVYNTIRTDMNVSRLVSQYTKPLKSLGLIEVSD